jgi:glycine/D-amino acid oxidase-like deaminating enzyme
VFFPDDLQLDPRRATIALLMAAQRKGLQIQRGEKVVAIRRDNNGNGRVNGVITQKGEITAPAIVCAAGVWSNDVINQGIGLELPIRPRKGHILVTSKTPGLINHPLLEGGYAATVQSSENDAQVALVAEKTSTGSLLLGSSRQLIGFDRRVSVEVMQAIATRALRFLPKLANVNIIRCYTGLRPWSPDHLPLIGPLEKAPGLYLAAGHEGAGICLAPISGKLIADWITDNIYYSNKSLTDLRNDVSPNRFGL